MKKSAAKFFIQLFFVIVLCCSAALAQPRRAKSSAKAKQPPRELITQAAPEYAGEVNGLLYRNTYFGLRLNIPRGWNVQGEAAKQQIRQRSQAMIAARSEEEKAQLEAAVDRTKNLLTLSKLPPGTPGQFNAIFMCAAEPVPLSTTGTFYISQLKKILDLAQMPVKIEDEGTEMLNGVQFYTLTILLGPPESLARQKYFVLIKKGYALAFITTVFSDSDTEAMNGILKSVSFQ